MSRASELLDLLVRQATNLAFDPAQARGADGRWVDTTLGVLTGLETHQLAQQGYLNAPTLYDYGPEDAPLQVDQTAVMELPEKLRIEMATARGAYLRDRTHEVISNSLRSGVVDPQPDVFVDEAGQPSFFDPEEPDGAWVSFYGSYEVDGDGEGVVRAIDSMMTHSKVTAPLMLFRGITVEDYESFKPGTVWHDPAYTSATYNPNAASMFAEFRAGLLPEDTFPTEELREEDTTGLPMVLSILVPPGTGYVDGAESLGELVLERGLTFEVVDVREGEALVKASRTQGDES